MKTIKIICMHLRLIALAASAVICSFVLGQGSALSAVLREYELPSQSQRPAPYQQQQQQQQQQMPQPQVQQRAVDESVYVRFREYLKSQNPTKKRVLRNNYLKQMKNAENNGRTAEAEHYRRLLTIIDRSR